MIVFCAEGMGLVVKFLSVKGDHVALLWRTFRQSGMAGLIGRSHIRMQSFTSVRIIATHCTELGFS